tara:strand:- start:495 stop:1523 length:1029 start_codon:yes stop_codon:yes gene_type:complete
MPKRFLGNIMTDSPTAPDGNYTSSAASGVWSLAEALSYTKGGLWPTTGNAAPSGLFMGGMHSGGTRVNTVDSISILTTGNATDFGDLSGAGADGAGVSSSTRGVQYGGGGSGTNVIEYFTFGSAGNATDFGDATKATYHNCGMGSNVRGISALTPSGTYLLYEYITIASTGNGTDFGDDLALYRSKAGGCSSTTRGLVAGGLGQGQNRNHIAYVTIASVGNASDFGDLTVGRQHVGGLSSNTRGIFYAGNNGSRINVIDYVTIASTGNATDFGNAGTLAEDWGCTAGLTRGVAAGGGVLSTGTDTIEYITIATTGNAADFGNLTQTRAAISACSNTHGGIAA